MRTRLVEDRLPEQRLPTRSAAFVFAVKVQLLQLRRGIQDRRDNLIRHVPREEASTAFPFLLTEVRSPLWSDESAAERLLQWGKVQNLRRAAQCFHGVNIPAGAAISFWKQVGRVTRRRGFTDGRELREGCIIPALGGGLCQLSNALYDAALKAGIEVVERHPHTRRIPGSAAEAGRDATVFWNYLDLRLRCADGFRLTVTLTENELIVRVFGTSPLAGPSPIPRPKLFLPLLDTTAHGCLTCGQNTCFRHDSAAAIANRWNESASRNGHVAFLVEEFWPEYAAYLTETRQPHDTLMLPIDGQRWRLPRYAYPTAGWENIEAATVTTLRRAITARRSRHLTPPQIRAMQLEGAERLAREFGRRLTPDTTHLTVAQPLLPYLWRDGFLGGRTFDVLMTRLPLEELHARLDAAIALHPERTLLGDFRAPSALVAAEREALQAARRVITPHTLIAALFAERAVLLPWKLPTVSVPSTQSETLQTMRRTIVFPGPTTARKGAYEVREAARALDLEVLLLGRDLEGTDFWNGVRTRRITLADEEWKRAIAVVQPSLVEDCPRVLLAALAAGVPVITTAGSGLPEQDGVTLVPAFDTPALITALKQ